MTRPQAALRRAQFRTMLAYLVGILLANAAGGRELVAALAALVCGGAGATVCMLPRGRWPILWFLTYSSLVVLGGLLSCTRLEVVEEVTVAKLAGQQFVYVRILSDEQLMFALCFGCLIGAVVAQLGKRLAAPHLLRFAAVLQPSKQREEGLIDGRQVGDPRP